MLKTLLDAQFRLAPDGLVQLAPLGEFPGVIDRAHGDPDPIVQIVDAEAVAAMVRRFAESAQQGVGMLVDFDHESLQPDGSTRAAGWIQEMQAREDGLYARIRWSAAGLAAVQGGDYLYLSPVFPETGAEELGRDAAGHRRLRLREISRAAVTNDPGLRGIRAVANRATPQTPDPKGPQMIKLAKLLNLPDTATEDDLAAALQGKLDRLAELETKAADAQADADLAPYEGQIADRAAVKAAIVANRDSGLKLLAALKPLPAATPDTSGRPAVSRRAMRLPGADASGIVVPPDAAVAARIRNRAAAIRREQQTSWQRAWNLAAAEVAKTDTTPPAQSN